MAACPFNGGEVSGIGFAVPAYPASRSAGRHFRFRFVAVDDGGETLFAW